MAPRNGAPRPEPTPEEADRARAERRVRALETPLDVRPRPDPRFVRLEVRNPAHGTRYDVVLPAYPDREGGFCGCSDFGRRGIGTCKHLEAAWIWVTDHPDEVPARVPGPDLGEVWEEIDRGLKQQARARQPDPVRYRIAGAVLAR